MSSEDLLTRVTARPDVFGGKPIIRNLRISVEMVVSLLSQGESAEAILQDFPELEPDDILACFTYAHRVISDDRLDQVLVRS